MCLAVPGQVISIEGLEALVDFQGNRLGVNCIMTPDVRPRDWVLVHAGFAIAPIDEQQALQTWDYLNEADALMEAGADGENDSVTPTRGVDA